MSRTVLDFAALLVAVLGLYYARKAQARGLPVPPAAAFPDQADSPFGADPTGYPVVIY